ncbi:hypothetical protein GCM10008015_29920 [Flavobacterium palustre]|uniref:ApeA N-terminal domain-containing protein n=1 Tax=Flavobacterium palustre TaxID=1476463 RepID=A0ABQ1HT22_9FLAO|nr:hypothetical protein [Flavobacterium palustre]GGA87284.1 hypothetical protein GCM10008015_29920 [Flavobacterium palustre]
MKISYLLECYDVIFRQTISPITNSNKTIFEALSNNENNSYRIFEIEINKNKNTDNLKICQTFHSLHPKVQELELKSIFHFNEFVEFIPVLKSIIEFTGENIFIAKHPECTNKFYVYEKCSINEIPVIQRNLFYTHQILKNENLNIKRAIKEQVFNYKSNLKIEHFIHKIQLSLESQLHLLIKHIEPKSKKELYEYSNNYDKIDCLKCQFSHLEKLLIFLEREYIDYLNDKSMVPYRTVLIDEVEIASKIEFVRNSLLSMVIDKELLQIIFEPLLNLTTLHTHEKISYYQYNYSKKYLIDIAKFIYQNPNGITQLEWCNWLIEMHVNMFNFFDYITSILKNEFNNCDTEMEKLNLMFDYLKIYNQSKNKHCVSYKENLPSIKFQIYNWLEEEIEFLSRKTELTKKIEHREESNHNHNKIHLDLSVAQLAYVLNLLIKAGLIKNNNLKEVLQVATEIFKTDMTESISFDSLRSKFYNVETSTSDAVKLKIENLLNFTKL